MEKTFLYQKKRTKSIEDNKTKLSIWSNEINFKRSAINFRVILIDEEKVEHEIYRNDIAYYKNKMKEFQDNRFHFVFNEEQLKKNKKVRIILESNTTDTEDIDIGFV